MLETLIVMALVANTFFPFYLYVFLSTPKNTVCIMKIYVGIHIIFSLIYYYTEQRILTAPSMILITIALYFGAVYWFEVRKIGSDVEKAKKLFSKYISKKIGKVIYLIFIMSDVVVSICASYVWKLRLIDYVYMLTYFLISIIIAGYILKKTLSDSSR